MNETVEKPLQQNPLLKELGISHIGTLVLLGQGPVQDSATKVKLQKIAGGQGEANSWMSMIARSGAALFKTGEVDTIIPSGRATGGMGPTEADLMEATIRNLTKNEKTSPNIIKEPGARNTLYNFINTANIIDAQGGDKKNITIVCAHFHKPRIKVLASLFGFDPARVISAEEILAVEAQIKHQMPRGEKFDPKGFDRQASMLDLLQIRLGRTGDRTYFDRKKARALKNMNSFGVEDTNAFYIEEQKSAADRMRDERRWVRGLAMEHQYVVPLLGELKDDNRLRKALNHFPKDMLIENYGIDIDAMDITEVRQKLDPEKWSHLVVKEGWASEPYEPDVMDRLQRLGVSREDRERLSGAQVPEIQFIGNSL